MVTLLIVLHIIVCLFLVVIVLLQHGKGADIGATFGGGGSQTLFGTEGPIPLLNKITTGAAVIFMLTSVSLAYFSSHTSTVSVMDEIKKQPVKVEKKVEKKDIAVPVPVNVQEPQAVAPEAPEAKQKAAPEAKQKAAPEAKQKAAPEAKQMAAPEAKQKAAPEETKTH